MLGRRIGDERVEVSVWILGYLLLKANVSHRHLVYNDQAELLRGLIRNAPLVGASQRKAVMERSHAEWNTRAAAARRMASIGQKNACALIHRLILQRTHTASTMYESNPCQHPVWDDHWSPDGPSLIRFVGLALRHVRPPAWTRPRLEPKAF